MRAILAALFVICPTVSATAQYQRPVGSRQLSAESHWESATLTPLQIMRRAEHTYWKAGMLVGAGLGALLGIEWMSNYHGLCKVDGKCTHAPIGRLILPTFTLGVIGTFIGDAFKKH
jgi:hypothetical protein